MDENKKILSDKELEEVTGGSHLSSKEVKAMEAGRKLMIEDEIGLNVGEATYLGEYDDPGPLSFLRCRVRIDKLYYKDSDGTQTFQFGGYPTVREGQTVYIPRWYLDFPERA